MKPTEQKRFDPLYQRHLRALKLQGMSASTIDAYARAVRRVAAHHDCCHTSAALGSILLASLPFVFLLS